MEDRRPGKNKGFFEKISEGFGHVFGMNREEPEKMTEEIRQMVSEGHERGALEDDEAQMINNIFDFSGKEAADIMTHRKNIVGVEVGMSFEEAARLMLRERFSRYPVYEEDIDNIIGILHLKDLLRAAMKYGQEHVSIRASMRTPYFVPDTQNIDSLFKDMQQRKLHMAVVIDEYGQTAGIVAMEDILEEIVGNIFDEYDVAETYIQKIGSSTYIMKGEAPLDEVREALQISLDGGEDFDTLNGLLVAKLEHIPAVDERVSVELEGYTFHVLSVRHNTIASVEVRKIAGSEENAENKAGRLQLEVSGK